jgi:hypothetical protein
LTSSSSPKVPSPSNALLTGILLISFLSLLLFLFHGHFLTACFPFSRYIHRKLHVKNALSPLSLPDFLLEWIDVHSDLCVYTAIQVAKFPPSYLKECGWYLDCSRAFVPVEEETLYGSLVNFGPDVIELDEELEEPTPALASVEKDVTPVNGRGRGKKALAHASSQVSSISNAKASVQRNVAPATTVLGSPTGIPFATLANPVVALSNSGVTIPSVPRKRKVVAPDTSATSSDMSSCIFLIENVDMGELIEDLMKTKVPPPAYRRIQDFLGKVCVHCFILSFNVFHHFFDFSLSLHFGLSGWSGLYSSKHQA